MKNIVNFIREFYLLDAKRNVNLDLIRSIAIIAVFNFHFRGGYEHTLYNVQAATSFSEKLYYPMANFFLNIMSASFLGVDMLFILSGYLAYISGQKAQGFWSYISQRYVRLVPVVFFVVLLPGLGMHPAKDYFDNLLFLKLFRESKYLNFVTWIITYTVYFYIWIGITLIVIKNHKIRSIVGLVLLTLIMLPGFYPIPDKVRFLGFFYGILAAIITSDNATLRKDKSNRFARILFFPALLAVIIIMSQLSRHWPTIESTPLYHNVFFSCVHVLFFILFINAVIRQPVAVFLPKVSAPISIFAMISYSFFILHATYTDKNNPLMVKLIHLAQFFSLESPIVHYILAFFLTAALASVIFYFLERPYFTRKSAK
ncbi:MAG: acyltransferase family protein [Turneriella sp.]|nr:acyltransferase family protein [Turneriella sp.]